MTDLKSVPNSILVLHGGLFLFWMICRSENLSRFLTKAYSFVDQNEAGGDDFSFVSIRNIVCYLSVSKKPFLSSTPEVRLLCLVLEWNALPVRVL